MATKDSKVRDLLISYKAVFLSEHGEKVLADLAKLCYYDKTTYPLNGDVNTMLRREGMRELFIHIKRKLKVKADKLEDIINQYDEELYYD